MSRVDEYAAALADGRTVARVSSGMVTSRRRKRVQTMRGVQHHSGYFGYVLVTFDGARRPETFRCCFHQKPKAAREHAAVLSRAFARLIERNPA